VRIHSFVGMVIRRFATAAAIWFAAAAVVLLTAAVKPGHAVPAFSRMYGVPCTTCHTVPPQLNAAGRTFQANLFRWAEGGPARRRGLIALPISGIATAAWVNNTSLDITSGPQFETLELFASDSFTLDAQRNGGYFVDVTALVREGRAGDMEAAWAALPVAGKKGQLALTAGQFTPMMYQYDPVNSLTRFQPVGLSVGTDGITFANATPGLRLDYFDNRGKGTADGNYVAVGLPFEGHLTLNKDADLGDPKGLFLHGFRRQGKGSLGAFGYVHGNRNQIGLLGTFEPSPTVTLFAAAATSHDGDFGNSRGLSFQADWIVTPGVALTGRLESTSGFQDDTYPIFAVNYFPFKKGFLRLSAETTQQKGNHQNAIYAYLMY
jgi:hypothetical protein